MRWRSASGSIGTGAAPRERATASFLKRFPIGDGSLYDVVDVDHESGRNDPAFRPNQIFAAGGLPVTLLQGAAARALVDLVEDRLWTPLGPRSLDPRHPDYRGRYQGGVVERDGAYHQGTVWPWLAGAFVEAWLNARDGTDEARAEARRRFVEPLAGLPRRGRPRLAARDRRRRRAPRPSRRAVPGLVDERAAAHSAAGR